MPGAHDENLLGRMCDRVRPRGHQRSARERGRVAEECRVKPLRERDAAILALYDQFFSRQSLGILPLSDAVVDKATELRAVLGIKTPDALHLASAIIARAEVFVTGDAALQRCKEVRVAVVP
jgi:predicted nucleic acid-binding protein